MQSRRRDERIEQLEDPASEPVTLAEIKAQVIASEDDDDDLLLRLGAVARDYVERSSGLLLITRSMRYSLTGPAGRARVALPFAPVSEVTAITYLDADLAEQTLDPADFRLVADRYRAELLPKPGQAWPVTSREPAALSITCAAGFANAAAVPQNLRHAIFLLTAHYYRHREAVLAGSAVEIPLGVEALIAIDRRGWAGA